MSRNTGLLHPGDIIGKPDVVTAVVLATGTTNAQAFDIPAGMSIASFSFNSDFWCGWGSTGVNIPSTSSTASTGSEFNPGTRNFGSTLACTGISLAAEVATKGSIGWYIK